MLMKRQCPPEVYANLYSLRKSYQRDRKPKVRPNEGLPTDYSFDLWAYFKEKERNQQFATAAEANENIELLRHEFKFAISEEERIFWLYMQKNMKRI